MLARLQQFTTLWLLAATAIAAFWFALAPLLIVFAYALFLAFEFVLMAAMHGNDPAPRATPGQLLRAWLGEVTTAPRVFFWRQPFRADVQPDHLGADARGRRGVVLVHGFFCNRGLWNPWLARLRAQGIPFVAVNLEPVFGSIDAYPAIVDAAVRRVEAATGLAPVVVAHSMGGLAVRAWLAPLGDAARVHRIVTIGTPHRGTWLARFALSRNGEQMQPGGGWLDRLAAREPAHQYGGFTCFYSHCDNIVFPASTATLPGADNRHLQAVAHVHMAYHEAVFSEVQRWLGAPPATAPVGQA